MSMRGTRGLTVAAMMAALLAGFYALGGGIGGRHALASVSSKKFCDLTDAGDLLARVGEPNTPGSIRLVANKPAVEPGLAVQARLANAKQIAARFGSEFEIQRYDGVAWKTDPSSPDGPWPRRAGKLPPGRAAGCFRFLVPVELKPGRYRFSTRIEWGSKKQRATAGFVVQVDQ